MRNYFFALILALLLSGCGFIRSSDSNIAPPIAHKVVNTAYSQIGKKYLSGGTSPATGFDCSGLVWWAYKRNGLQVPRKAVEQAYAGAAISPHNARPGDIVVFRTSHSPNGLHTGLHAGGSMFIHSPRKGSAVRTESMEIPYWGNKLVMVRRVLQ
ncbi:MAG: C40 family peptidase [Desulfovibrio sp.]|jgi:cell wall-associated NlpC family hydrolase|nr:C40 family peptidase [Desulfovibrio sp.]